MGRITHRAVDSLGDDVRRVIAEGYRAGHTAAAIARDLKTETGQSVAERTVSREMKRMHDEQRRRDTSREQARALLAAAREENIVASELIQALATQALMEDPESFTGQDAIKVQFANLEAEKIRLKRAKLDQDNQRLALDREKFEDVKTKLANIRRQAEQAKEAVNKAGESISPELKKQLLDVYDLAEAEA